MAEWEAQATEHLNRLTPPHVSKKRATVIALVDARIAGTPEEDVWRRPETCSRTIYHSKWKRDPVFANVLDSVEELARNWHDGRAVRALAQAAERMALASPIAAAAAIRMLQDADAAIVLRAAFGILDRAGVETAQKGSHELTGKDGHSLIKIYIPDNGRGDADTTPAGTAD